MFAWSTLEIIASVVGLCFSFFSVFFLKKIALRVGLVDRPGDRKIHSKPIPYLGGAAIYFGFWGVLLIGYISLFFLSYFSRYIDSLAFSLFSNAASLNLQIWTIFITSTMIFILGLLDDYLSLSPAIKLLFEFVGASLLYFSGIRITLFIPIGWVQFLLTTGWIVLMTNSFNLLDNMNGLSSGVGMICTVFLAITGIMTGQYLITMLALIFACAILGFWIHNFYAGSIFMGDAGSLFIGFMVSVIVILETFSVNDSYPLLPIFLPVTIFAIPLYDTLSVICIRKRSGVSIFTADKNHFSHRLVDLGLSKRWAVIVIMLFCVMTGISSLLLLESNSWRVNLLIFLQVTLCFVLVSVLEFYGRKAKKMRSIHK